MFIRRTIRKAVPHDLQFFAVLLNNDPADVGGWGLDVVREFLAFRVKVAVVQARRYPRGLDEPEA